MPPRSRQTRHQDVASRSRQGQVIDLDPTDGLPVQRYGLQKVKINQDASTDPTSTNAKSTSSAEWAAQFNTPQHPWPEHPLPSYFHQLTPWNQEMIRRARAGNTNPVLSTYDRKTNAWISGAEQERKAATTKLNATIVSDSNEKPRNGDDAESSKSGDDSGEDSSNEYAKSADEDDFDGDETTPFKPSSSKRRKVASRQNGSDDVRIIEVTRWVPLAPSQAEKAHDKNFLAPRRPGMPALYHPDYAQRMFGHYLSSATYTGTSGYDLGEGGGLNNATSVLGAGSTNEAGAVTPRKNIPPRRKKKKLGGPGRKKANPNPTTITDAGNIQNSAAANTAGQGTGTDAMEGVEGGQDASGNTTRNPGDINMDGGQDDGDNESGSEAEGSEEGEIDETGDTGVPAKEETPPPPPPPTITEAVIDTAISDPSPKPEPIDEAKDVAKEIATEPTDIADPIVVDSTTEILTALPEPDAQAAVTVTITDTDTEMTEPTQTGEPNTVADPDSDPVSATIPEIIPPPTNPEEKEIIEENAEAITGTGSSTAPVDKEDATAVIETATTEPAATTEPTEPTEPREPAMEVTEAEPAPEVIEPPEKKEEVATEPVTAEVDFLGGLDAAIDREVSEGA